MRAIGALAAVATVVLTLLVGGCGGRPGGDPRLSSDAGGDASLSSDAGADGGLSSDPGFVRCGGAPCRRTDGKYCCIESGGYERCVPTELSSCAGLWVSCNEAADCFAGELCCAFAAEAPFFVYSTFCSAGCDPVMGDVQVCGTSAECRNERGCVAQLCRGRVVQTCGAIRQELCD